MALRLVRVKNSENWYVRGSVGGRSIFQSTGLNSERLANAYKVNLESQMQDAHAFGKKDSVLFSEVAAQYHAAGGSARYLKPIAEALAKTPVETLKQADIDALAVKMLPVQSNATRDRQVYTPFIAVMNYAADNEYCSYRKWRRPKKQEKVRKSRSATVLEIAKLYDNCLWRIRPMLITLAYTGLRMGELIRAQWDDVDLDARWLVVKKSKTGLPRGVPLHRVVVRELLKTPKHKRTGAIFKSRGDKPYKYLAKGGSTAKRARIAAYTKAKIPPLTWHDFRHTCATWLQMAGIARETRQDILGHSRGAVHNTYVHVPSKAKLEAIDALPDFTDFSHCFCAVP